MEEDDAPVLRCSWHVCQKNRVNGSRYCKDHVKMVKKETADREAPKSK